jgi:hypothetical protein
VLQLCSADEYPPSSDAQTSLSCRLSLPEAELTPALMTITPVLVISTWQSPRCAHGAVGSSWVQRVPPVVEIHT